MEWRVPRLWRNIPQRYQLIGNYCSRCGNHFYPPRKLCPNCRRSGELVQFKFSGKGELISYTLIPHRDETGSRIRILGLIKLEEGPQIISEICCLPQELRYGLKLKAVFRRLAQDGEEGVIHYGLKWAPDE